MWAEIREKLHGLGASWSLYTSLGTFALYFLGYLTLRFQLSSWGVATDLSVLDERYFFAGARFLVYLVASVPNALVLSLPLLLAWWLLNRLARFRRWRATWNHALAGVVFAVAAIQLVGRRCFDFLSSLLLQDTLEGDRWLRSVLLDASPASEGVFFGVLVLSVGVTAWFYVNSSRRQQRPLFLEGLLAFLLAVEVLLLPVNYGVIVSTRYLPRVANFPDAEAWLVWEGKDSYHFLLLEGQARKLVAVPRNEVKRLELSGVDPILRRLFGPKKGTPRLRP